MKTAIIKIFPVLFLFIHNTIAAQNSDAEIKKQVSRYLDLVGNFGNAGQVLIAQGNNIIVNKNYGYESREGKTPVVKETIFELASASKMFTATAILKLEMQGRLNVTDTIGKYFDNCPKDKAGITIHQLLTHTSGVMGGDIIDDFQSTTKDELCKKILGSSLRARPGQKFIYSNAGFNLLAAIIEKQSGKEYKDYLLDELFIPAGMKHTFINGSAELRDRKTATAYNGTINNGSPARQEFNARTWGGGSVCSTVSDLWLWHLALQGNAILNEAAKDKMFKAQMAIAADNNYGYGCFVYWIDGKKIIDFIGETEHGFNCTFRNFVDDDATFISLSNSSQPNERHNRWFLDAHIKNLWKESRHFPMPPQAVKITTGVLTALNGVYKYNDSRIKVSSPGDGLLLEAEGLDASALLLGYSSSQLEKCRNAAARVDTYMQDFKQKTNDGIIAVFGQGNAPDYIKDRDGLIDKYGYLESYTIKGAIFDRDTNFIVTPVQMKFKDKAIDFFIMWNMTDPSKPMADFSSADMVTIISGIFVYTADNEFVSYNFFKDRIAASVKFNNGHNEIYSTANTGVKFVKVN